MLDDFCHLGLLQYGTANGFVLFLKSQDSYKPLQALEYVGKYIGVFPFTPREDD